MIKGFIEVTDISNGNDKKVFVNIAQSSRCEYARLFVLQRNLRRNQAKD